eukprot:356285-Chlamydomonas_euryale.AAC.1
MWDHNTGRSKGYGFVSFRCRADADAALVGMQGCMIGSRRVRVGWAQHKEEGVSDAGALDFDSVDRGDPANTNVYVSNVAPETSEADLHLHFSHFGKLEAVRRRFCLFGRRSGLVVFSHFGKLEAVVCGRCAEGYMRGRGVACSHIFHTSEGERRWVGVCCVCVAAVVVWMGCVDVGCVDVDVGWVVSMGGQGRHLAGRHLRSTCRSHTRTCTKSQQNLPERSSHFGSLEAVGCF